jgi:hypothetical protein
MNVGSTSVIPRTCFAGRFLGLDANRGASDLQAGQNGTVPGFVAGSMQAAAVVEFWGSDAGGERRHPKQCGEWTYVAVQLEPRSSAED